MKVKNGIASRRSFDTMPNTRSGRLDRKSSENKPTSMPIKPKNKPSAMSENATGKPISRNTIRPANMTGAMLATIAAPRSPAARTAWKRGSAPVSIAARRTISATPCSASSAKPIGRTSLTGQRTSPPALDDTSPMRHDSAKSVHDMPVSSSAAGSRKMPRHTRSPTPPARRERPVDEVDPHVAVQAQRLGGAEEYDHREEIPLHLEPGVRADREEIPRDRVAGAHGAGEQHAPGGEPGRSGAQRIDAAQEELHAASGGTRLAHGRTSSSAPAAANKSASACQRATSCRPTGSPSRVKPAGTLSAGWPVRLNTLR